MNNQNIREYLTPRTHKEALVLEKQTKQKLNTLAFFGLSAGTFGMIPILSVALPVVGVMVGVGAGVYCTCKVLENHKLATENHKLYHAMKKEQSILSENYKDLGEIAETINNKESSISSILNSIKKLRNIEEKQNNQLKIK